MITLDTNDLTTLGGLLTVLLALLGYLRVMKNDLRRDLGTEIGGLRTEMHAGFERLDRRIDDLKTDLTTKIEDVDHRLTTKIDDLDQRLTARIDDLDRRLSARIDDLDRRLTQQIDDVKTDLGGQILRLDKRLSSIEQRTYDIGRVLPPPQAS